MRFNVENIRSEGQLKSLIDEIKNNNKYSKFRKEYNIYTDFPQLKQKK